MSANSPRIDQPKTECPMCGNVWQEHTLSELNGCKAILHLQVAAALAREARLKGNASVTPPRVEICPVCNKLPDEHAEVDLRSCVGKWRKSEQGSTGLELQDDFLGAQFENEELDPVKRAKLRAKTLQTPCACGKALGDHTQNEIRTCFHREPRV